MADKSRLMARWSSSHDWIRAQTNDKTKRAIHEWSELPQKQIRSMKIRFVKTIASFNNNADDPSVQFMSKINYFKNQSNL